MKKTYRYIAALEYNDVAVDYLVNPKKDVVTAQEVKESKMVVFLQEQGESDIHTNDMPGQSCRYIQRNQLGPLLFCFTFQKSLLCP